MLVTERIDLATSTEILLNEVFQHIFQSAGARAYLGFSQISQVASDEGLPGWYLWFDDMKGACYIGITGWNARHSDKVPTNAWQREPPRDVCLVLRYFPDMEEKLFETFSCFEQIFRMGPHFDATGTTTFEGSRTMPENFFVVGHMIISFHEPHGDIDFFCQAPERWREYRTDGLTLVDSEGTTMALLAPGECDRDVEGWNLSRHIFDKIVSAYSFLSRRPPSVVGVAAGPSNEFQIDTFNNIHEIKNERWKEFLLLVSFGQNGNLHDAEEMLLSQSKRLIGIWTDVRSIPAEWCNHSWWSVADRHFHDDHGFICSCYDGRHECSAEEEGNTT